MCPRITQYRLIFVTPKDGPHRCVAFLSSSDKNVDPMSEFNKLTENEQARLRTAFDYWTVGHIAPTKHHGWDKSSFHGKYTKCHVFKGKDANVQFRLYGFKCHPKEGDRSFELCVIVNSARKKKKQTDEQKLMNVIEVMENRAVQEVITKSFSGE